MDLRGLCGAISCVPMQTWTWQALSEQQFAGGKHANEKMRTKEGRREGFKTFCPRTKSTSLKHFININTPLPQEKSKQAATTG